MMKDTHQPPPLSFAEDGLSWGELAARFSITRQWPVFGAESCYRDRPWVRHTQWRDDPPPPATTLREQFGLDRKDEWDIQEDDFCFECGVVRDRSGELTIGDERDDEAFLRLVGSGHHNGADAQVVLESWQERFGAYVYSAYGATLELVVARPPTTVEEARLVAREQFHFCRYDSQFHGIRGMGSYVAQLVESHVGRFWWD